MMEQAFEFLNLLLYDLLTFNEYGISMTREEKVVQTKKTTEDQFKILELAWSDYEEE